MRCPTCGAVRAAEGPCDHRLDNDPRLGSMVGNYRLTSVLGRGGMGTVYRGDHAYLDRAVAVKILHDEYLADPAHTAQFLREAQAASRIRHPNIVDVMDFGETGDGGVYFLMEILDGEALDTVIAREAPLPAIRTINIMNQVARALDAVHSHGIVHGDLKPENIVLIQRSGTRSIIREVEDRYGRREVTEPEGRYDFVKLLDFGTARLIAAIHETSDRVMGTPWYMAPEMIKGQLHDAQIDVYAAGILLYEMLTGSLPFDAETTIGILQQQIYAAPIPPRELVDDKQRAEITDDMEKTILVAMAKEPKDRFPTIEAFRQALGRCYASARYADPGPRAMRERARSETDRRRSVDPPGPLPPSPTVEDKLSNLFGAWSKRVVEKHATPRSTPAAPPLLRRVMTDPNVTKTATPSQPPASAFQTLRGYHARPRDDKK